MLLIMSDIAPVGHINIQCIAVKKALHYLKYQKLNTGTMHALITRPGRIPLFSNVNEFNNVVKLNIAGVVKINNVVKFNLGVTSFWRRTWGPIYCFDDKFNLTLLKIYQK